MLKLVTASLGIFCLTSAHDHFHMTGQQGMQDCQPKTLTRNAICILYPNNNSNVKGLISFSQESYDKPCKIVASVRGLRPNGFHGFHIHEWGDLTEGCTSAGPHYNPYNAKHGDLLDSERHVGDLGNLKADEKGDAYSAFEDTKLKLFGEDSIVGRSCVVHEHEDDLGRGHHQDSHTTGHSGPRIACGVIGLTNEFKNLPPK